MSDAEATIEVIIELDEDWSVYRLYEVTEATKNRNGCKTIPLSLYTRFKRLDRQWAKLQEELEKL